MLYHFDIADAYPPIVGEVVELASLADARKHALRYAGQLLMDQTPDFWTGDEWMLTVSDQDRLILFAITVLTANAPALGLTA